MGPYLAHNRASQPQNGWLREMLRAPTSAITVTANRSIAGFVKCYGPDTAHNRASQPQYCWLREMLRAPTSPVNVLANHRIAGSVKCYRPRLRP